MVDLSQPTDGQTTPTDPAPAEDGTNPQGSIADSTTSTAALTTTTKLFSSLTTTTTRPPTTTSSRPPATSGGTVTFGAAGDFGGKDSRAGTVMEDMKRRNLAAFFLLGDLSYDEITPESAWCDWVHGYLGANYPMAVVAGNHEEDSRVDGQILDFASCMPDRLGSEMGPGGYSLNYASDLGPVTVVSISPDLVVGGVDYTYASGSPERNWLVGAIGRAKAEGDWVIVGMHKNCITIGEKSCEIGESFLQLLIDQKVDLVLQGHEHAYQRSHSLSQVNRSGVGTIVDDGSDRQYAKGSGTVIVIAGTAGRSMRDCSHGDSEYGNFAVHWCGEEATDTKGYLVLQASGSSLSAEFVTTTGTPFTDSFTIS